MKRIPLILLLLAILSPMVFAASPKDIKDVAIGDLMRELQATDAVMGKTDDGSGVMRIAFYFPIEYWQAVLLQNKAVSPAMAAANLHALDGVAILAVARCKVLIGGKFEFYSEADVVTSVSAQYTAKDGKITKLELEEDISPQAEALVAGMKPVVKGSLGKLGQNMQFLVLKDKDAAGKRIADPRHEGKLTFIFDKLPGDDGGKSELLFPLNALCQPRTCDKCNHPNLDVHWAFCPFCGNKLKP